MVERLPGLPSLPDVSPSRGTPTVQQANPSAGDVAASAFSSLAQGARDLRRELQPLLDDRARKKAREDYQAAADEADDDAPISPALRRVISRQDAIYNQTVQELAHARTMNAAERTLADLRREHAYEPQAFRQAAVEWRNTYLRGVQSAYRPELENALTGYIDDLELQVSDERRANDTREAQQALELRLENINARITSGIAEQGGDFVSTEQFAELQTEAQDVISVLVEGPQYEWSSERGARALDDVANAGREALVYHEADAVLRTQGEAAALGFVEDYLETQELSPNDRIATRSRLIGHINNTVRRRDLIDAQREAEADARKEAAEGEARQLQNAITRAVAEGRPVDPTQVDTLQRYSDAGLLTGSEFRVTVNAINADPNAEPDQSVLASFYDEARDLSVSVDELRTATLDAVGAGNITAAQRERILGEAEDLREAGMERGVDVIQATFARGLMDFNQAELATAEDAALNDLREWRRNNPDAPDYELRAQAVRFAAIRGREIPPPPVPQVSGAGLPPRPRDGIAAFSEWQDAAQQRVDDVLAEGSGASETEVRAAMDMQRRLDAYAEWHRQRINYEESLTNGGE